MSYAMVFYKHPETGLTCRAFRGSYDPETGVLKTEDRAATVAKYQNASESELANFQSVLVEIKKEQMLYCNTEARQGWGLKDIPCCCVGYGADLKEWDLAKELRAERDAGDPRSEEYIKWRDKFIKDVESSGITAESLRAAYPNVPDIT